MSRTNKRVYIETYGCQMNVADTEVVESLLTAGGYTCTEDMASADVILVNTCSVREHAEQRVYGRLGEFKRMKDENPRLVVGVLGCMAERLRLRLTTEHAKGVGHIADLIVGPDQYRNISSFVENAQGGAPSVAVQLSRTETYDDITPLRTSGISAWISVMRGCDKFCSFCVVPFTRGRERSRPMDGILREVDGLSRRGFREVTLLGQNVNSYRDRQSDFADLLGAVAETDPGLRVRFLTSHPQDFSGKLINTISRYRNICNSIHLPVQSGSDRILELMNRGYTSAQYRGLIARIRAAIPDVSLSTDVITGFPTESEEDHRRSLDLLAEIRFDGAFMFKYSPRENTPAYRMKDDIPEDVKTRRINEIIACQNAISGERNQAHLGQTVEVLVEGESKRSSLEWQGRTQGNKTVVFPKGDFRIGDSIRVAVHRATSATLFGSLPGGQAEHIEAAA